MKKPDPRLILFIAFLLNVLQSVLMPITEDEAYYWKYAQHLDWGYFDHPPMIALFIWLGNIFFPGTLGVRFITNIAWFIACLFMWYLLPEADRKRENSLWIFLLLILAMPLLNLYGIVSTPDAPLILFTAIYLFLFKQYIEDFKLSSAILLGIVSALLIYAKYHGVLVIAFTLIAHPKILIKRSFYVLLLVTFVLLLPHLYWQYQLDFPTLKYHLFDRSENELRLGNILNYLLNVFLVLNPLFLVIYFVYMFRQRGALAFPVHYHFMVWGAIVFFAFTSLRDHVEPHWIAFALVPLTVMVHKVVLFQKAWHRIFRIGSIISIVFILVIRVVLVLPHNIEQLPVNGKAFYSDIRQHAGDRKVAFINSYYGAAKYSFYTGDDAFSYNCMPYGKKQYDFWPYDKTYQGASVFLVGDWPSGYLDTMRLNTGDTIFYTTIDDFQVLSRVSSQLIEFPDPIKLKKRNKFRIEISNPYDYPLEFGNEEMLLKIEFYFFKGEKSHHFTVTADADVIPPNSSKMVSGSFRHNFKPGKYQLGVALKPGKLTAVPIGKRMEVLVAD